MKKNVKLAAVTALAGLSFSSSAWWGNPYGHPYWGGYAPMVAAPVVAAPVVAAPVATVSQEQLNTSYNPWGYGAFNPRGYSPFISGPGDFLNDPFMPPVYREMFRQSDAERQLTLKESQTRREAFHARTAAQRAAMDARRQAWLDSARAYNYAPLGYGAPFGYGVPLAIPAPFAATAPASAPEAAAVEQPAAAAEQSAAAADAPAAAPAPQPATVAAAPAPAAK